MKRTILGTFLCAVAAFAADDAFIGAWKMNVAKSKFSPGPPPQSASVTIEAGGRVTVEDVDSSGKATKWSYTTPSSGAATIEGVPDSNVMETRKGNVVEHTWRFAGQPAKGKGVISKDGKTMTYHISGTNSDGKKYNNVEIYEKQ